MSGFGPSGASLDERLIEAVKAHSGLDEGELIDAARHGGDTGWAGFTYSTDAAAFFDKHDELVWEVLSRLAEELGESNPAALIAGFNRSDMMHSYEGFKVLLAWFALEHAGYCLNSS